MYKIAIILALALGVGLSILLLGIIVDHSNNKGDSKGDYIHFSDAPLQVLERQDKLRKQYQLR